MVKRLDVDPGYLTVTNIGPKSQKWLKELEQYCRAKKRFKFKPKRSALIIVDAQQFFFNEKSHGYVQASNTILPNISWLNIRCGPRGDSYSSCNTC